MIDLQAWFSAHPLLATWLAWLVTSLLLWAFRPRTPAEYDKLPPRLAAFLQLLRALFGDGAKIVEAVRKILSGQSAPPVARSNARGAANGAFVAALAAFMLPVMLGVVAMACTPSAQATAVSIAARTEAKRIEYRAAVLECVRLHRFDCAAFDACQKIEGAKRGLPPLGECVETTRADALDAGLIPDGAL